MHSLQNLEFFVDQVASTELPQVPLARVRQNPPRASIIFARKGAARRKTWSSGKQASDGAAALCGEYPTTADPLPASEVFRHLPARRPTPGEYELAEGAA